MKTILGSSVFADFHWNRRLATDRVSIGILFRPGVSGLSAGHRREGEDAEAVDTPQARELAPTPANTDLPKKTI
jgi:hypothetical protein